MHNHPHLNKLHQLISNGGIQIESLLYVIKSHSVGMTPPGKTHISNSMFLENVLLTSVLDFNDDIDILVQNSEDLPVRIIWT